MCELLGVSRSGYYAWRDRGPSARGRRDEELTEMIEQIHSDSRGTYGSPRIHAELKAAGEAVGQKRVARLMREAGIEGVTRRSTPTTTIRTQSDRKAPDLVDRDFEPDAPNELWVADITYIPTDEGYLYLAVVLDAFSRRVIGWAMAEHLYALNSSSTHWNWPSSAARPTASSTTPTRAASIRPSSSENAAERPTYVRPWARSEIATTTLFAKVSSPHSNAN